MTTTVTQLADALQTLFTTTAEQLAHDTGLIRRHRQLTGPGFARALVFTWLDNPQATLDDLAQATALGGPPLTPQALDERFRPAAADFLHRLLAAAVRQVVAGQPSAVALLRRFNGVYLRDSTVIGLPAALAGLFPGCGGRGPPEATQAALKAQVGLELTNGALHRLTLHPGRQADTLDGPAEPPLPEGALRLADLGYFDLDVLQACGRQKAYFLSRLQPGTVVHDAGGKKWKLAAFLASRGADRIDEHVAVGAKQRLGCRLLALRAPEAVTRRRQQRARKEAQDHGRPISGERLAVCGWTVFITNVPGWLLSLQEAWVLYRVRWQIELLFKLWKSQGGVDVSRSEQPYRVLCEVLAKLLAMVVQHWALLVGGGGFSERSPRKAARAVRRQALHLAAVLGQKRLLRQALRLLQRLIRAAGRVHRRRQRPSTYQTLLNPEHDGLS